jgi:hypothetical protein
LPLATAAAMLWGTVGVASTMLPDGMTLSSFHLGLAQLAIAAPLLVLFSALVLGSGLWAIGARAWVWIAAVGVLAARYQLCLFVSLGQLGIARTALLTVCLPPLLVAGVSAVAFRQRPSAWAISALLLTVGGLMLGAITPPSLRQPCSSQAVCERGEVFRSADREPIREIGDAQRGIELAQMVHRAPRLVHSAGKRMACRDDAGRDQEARQILDAFSAHDDAVSKRPANKCASAVPACIR